MSTRKTIKFVVLILGYWNNILGADENFCEKCCGSCCDRSNDESTSQDSTNSLGEKKSNEENKKFENTKNYKHEEMRCFIELSNGRIASGGNKISGKNIGTIEIWNLNEETPEKTLEVESDVLCLLEFKEDNLLVGTSDKGIILFDLKTGKKCTFETTDNNTVAVNCLVKLDEEKFASTMNKDIIIWNYNTKEKHSSVLNLHEFPIQSLILLKDKNLCSGSYGHIKIYDWKNNKIIQDLGTSDIIPFIICELDDKLLVGGLKQNMLVWSKNKTTFSYGDHKRHWKTLLGKINENEIIFRFHNGSDIYRGTLFSYESVFACTNDEPFRCLYLKKDEKNVFLIGYYRKLIKLYEQTENLKIIPQVEN